MELNGVAGIHITASTNFTYEGPRSFESGSAGQGYVGSSDGPQPIELIVESSTLVTFNDVYFSSDNGKENEGGGGKRRSRGEKERGVER